MKTISNREFLAHPEMYFDMAREQEVRIRRGKQVFSLAPDDENEPKYPRELTEDEVWGLFARHYPDGFPPLGTDEEEIARAITVEELLKGIDEDLDRKWAERQRR